MADGKKIGSAYVELSADLTKLKQGFDQAQKSTEALGKTLGQKMTAIGTKMSSVGLKMTLGLTTTIGGLGTAMTKLAMDAEESENLFVVSMGSMEAAGRKWSEDLREQLGLNEYEIRKTLSTFNVMLDSMGLGTQEAYDMSKGLTQLSYDMASFYNLKPEEAFQKLQAGISGEIEPLKRLGILVNENTVQQVAYKNGIAKTGETLTEQQKVQARYLAIMEQTSKAQGDMARTLESPTNQLRILKDELKQTGIEFGQVLIPVLQSGIDILRDVTAKLAAMTDEQKENIVKWAAVAAAIGPALLIIGKILVVLPKLKAGFLLLKPVLAGFQSQLAAMLANPVILGLAALAVILVTLINKAKQLKETREAIAGSYEDMQAAHNEYVNKMAAEAGAAARVEYDNQIAHLQEMQAARDKYHEEAYDRWEDYRDKQVSAQKEYLNDELDALEDNHQEALDAIRKEYGVVEDSYKSKTDLANEYYDNEIARANEAYNEKVALINKELAEQLKLVDQETASKVRALQAEIEAIDNLTRKEREAEEKAREQARLTKLEAAVEEAANPEDKAKAQQELNDYITELEYEALLERRDNEKTILQERIDAVYETANEQKEALETAAAEEIETAKVNLASEIEIINTKRDGAIAAIQAERREKEAAETAKYEATKAGISNQLKEIENGKGAYMRALQREILEKRVAEDEKYKATKESVDLQIAEYERLATEAENIAAAAAAREAATNEDQKKRELLDLYQNINLDMQDYIASMSDKTWIGKGIDAWSGESKAVLAEFDREMEKVAAQLRAMGIPGFASGGVVTQPTLAMVGESGPEVIIPQDRFNEVIAAAQRGAQSGATGSNGQVNYVHSGEIKVTGVNDRGQLVDVINVALKDILRQEARAYG